MGNKASSLFGGGPAQVSSIIIIRIYLHQSADSGLGGAMIDHRTRISDVLCCFRCLSVLFERK